MEREGLVRSWWEQSTSGPARRIYELTGDGVDWLHVWASQLREVHGHLDAYLARYEGLVRAAPVERR